MKSLEQVAEGTGPMPWAVVAVCFVPAVVCAVAWVRVRSGWSGRAETLKGDHRGMVLSRVAYAIMPITVAMFVIAVGIGLIGGRLHYDDSGSEWSRIVAIISYFISMALLVWGVKEYYRPSSWRRRPPWLVEFERRHPRRD